MLNFDFRRQAMKPMYPKPRTIITQVAGSGTPAAKVSYGRNRSSIPSGLNREAAFGRLFICYRKRRPSVQKLKAVSCIGGAYSSFLKEQAARCRSLADKADKFAKRRLLDLAVSTKTG